jgi:drug/metabolite transporter (DMT)-like permease
MNPEERSLLRLRIVEDCVGLFLNSAVFYFLILLAISLPSELSPPSSLNDSLFLLKLRMTRLFLIGVALALLGIYGFLLSYNQIKSIRMLRVADEKFRRIYSIWSPIVGIFLLLLSIEIFRLPFILLNAAEKALGPPPRFPAPFISLTWFSSFLLRMYCPRC